MSRAKSGYGEDETASAEEWHEVQECRQKSMGESKSERIGRFDRRESDRMAGCPRVVPIIQENVDYRRTSCRNSEG